MASIDPNVTVMRLPVLRPDLFSLMKKPHSASTQGEAAFSALLATTTRCFVWSRAESITLRKSALPCWVRVSRLKNVSMPAAASCARF